MLRASLVAQLVKNLPATRETLVLFLGGEDPLEKGKPPTPFLGFPGGADGKESSCNAGGLGLIPGLGRSPGGRLGNPFHYSYLENLHGQRSLAGYSPWGHKESDATEQLHFLSSLSETYLSSHSITRKSCSPPGSSVHGDFPGKNTGVGCYALLQGIFPAQGSNPGLLHCRWILYQLNHQGSP